MTKDFDFDEPIDRRGTHSSKWDAFSGRLGAYPEDTIPMWVADMDFRAAPAVNEALRWAADHGVHGYFGDFGDFHRAFLDFMERRHRWRGQEEWLITTHGLVNAIGLCVQAFSEPGDGVAIFAPVYHMFANTIRANDRRAVESPMKNVQGRYEMDLEDLSARIDDRTKMVMLCSPQNPGGRVWTEEELLAVIEFCEERDLILISDEIHQDLVYPGAKHRVTMNVKPSAADRIVTLLAPTKTFNIAGGLTGVVAIPNEELRARFEKRKAASGALAPNRLGLLVSTAAYAEGDAWLDALVPYLQASRDRLDAVVAEIPGLRSMHLEATYLAWIDFSETGLSFEEIDERLRTHARIAVNPGPSFGPGGETFMRFNFACRRAILDTALERLAATFG
ncbi:MAG: MalY/PatB family protein [Alphaproteobacteria bacterium]|nr:MalY/PatB family protein [Alphaproteobacteria bacterium]